MDDFDARRKQAARRASRVSFSADVTAETEERKSARSSAAVTLTDDFQPLRYITTDFGLIMVAHTYEATACVLAEGTTLEDVENGCATITITQRDTSMGLDADGPGVRVVVTLSAAEPGAFTRELHMVVCDSQGRRQTLVLEITGNVMGDDKGKPMVSPHVTCLGVIPECRTDHE